MSETAAPAVLDFDCPRCTNATSETFYGPCESCREQLRATMGNEGREAQPIEYEPKMNVTPNHVATKE